MRDSAVPLGRLRHVQVDERRLSSEFLGQCLPLFVEQVGDHDPGAFACQPSAMRRSHTPCSPGDQRHFAIDSSHAQLLSVKTPPAGAQVHPVPCALRADRPKVPTDRTGCPEIVSRYSREAASTGTTPSLYANGDGDWLAPAKEH
ncbi:hypothetical protein GCM10009820_12920 [Leifsonia soli]